MSVLMFLCVDDVPYGLPMVVLRFVYECPVTSYALPMMFIRFDEVVLMIFCVLYVFLDI